MIAVWIMSYLFMSFVGAIAVLALALYLLKRAERKQVRENLRADNYSNLETPDHHFTASQN